MERKRGRWGRKAIMGPGARVQGRRGAGGAGWPAGCEPRQTRTGLQGAQGQQRAQGGAGGMRRCAGAQGRRVCKGHRGSQGHTMGAVQAKPGQAQARHIGAGGAGWQGFRVSTLSKTRRAVEVQAERVGRPGVSGGHWRRGARRAGGPHSRRHTGTAAGTGKAQWCRGACRAHLLR